MPVEILGLIDTRRRSAVPAGSGVDTPYLRRVVRAHENSGFDRLVINDSAGAPDGTQLAAHAAAHSDRLGFVVAHRPGLVFPTVAARTFATMDQLTGGRIAVEVVGGATGAEGSGDGDRSADPARTAEFVRILKKAWTSDEPFDFHGEFYDLDDFLSNVRPLQSPRPPLYMAGSSPQAYAVGAAEADVYIVVGRPPGSGAAEIARLRDLAAARRETPLGIGMSFRPILAATEELAWRRAEVILERAGAAEPRDIGPWTTVDALTTGGAALVGTPETVADALQQYVGLGVTQFLLHGFDPLDDAIEYGRDLIPRLRAAVPA